MGKRQNKSKEQIAQDMKNRGEIAEMKALAQNSILPVLIKHNQTAAQAVQVLEVMKQVALGKMNQAGEEKPFAIRSSPLTWLGGRCASIF